jgi:hypothetical protein
MGDGCGGAKSALPRICVDERWRGELLLWMTDGAVTKNTTEFCFT